MADLQHATACCMLSLLALHGAGAWSWPRMLLELPETGLIPAWISLPWGPIPDWNLIKETQKCRMKMDADFAKVVRPCDADNAADPRCKLRILIVSAVSKDYTDKGNTLHGFHAAVKDINQKYCQRWKFCDVQIFSDKAWDPKWKSHERHSAWQKVLALHKAVSTGAYDWYMWLDGDAAIIDQSFDLRFLPSMATPDSLFIVSKDIWNTPGAGNSNLGACLIKNGEASLKFLEEWWRVPDEVKDSESRKMGHPWEQYAFNTVMYVRHEKKIHRFAECFLFGHPLSLIDKPFIGHMCGAGPNQWKASERHRYFSFWNELIS
mmetsp:Transcript_20889/g.35678  ORF Transcript_20889/g.35678 Transcript_20889/m.35678 type:complete len:320 (-) Transcript_20889:38-997(-)